MLLFFVGLGATVWMYRIVPTGFIPQEDQGYLYVIVQAPPGSSLEYTTAPRRPREAIIAQDPDIEGAFSVMGFSFQRRGCKCRTDVCSYQIREGAEGKGGNSGGNRRATCTRSCGMLMVRPDGGLVRAIAAACRQGVGSYGRVPVQLQDTGGNTLTDLDRVAHQIVAAGSARKDLTDLYHDFLGERSAGAGHHRSREGQGDEHSPLADHHHARRFHGLGVHQRLRLQ